MAKVYTSILQIAGDVITVEAEDIKYIEEKIIQLIQESCKKEEVNG